MNLREKIREYCLLTCSQNLIQLVSAKTQGYFLRKILKMSVTMQKNHYCILLVISIFILLKDSVFAVSCKELDSPEKIKSFMNESHLSNPFLRKNVSVTVILDACEGKVCKSKSKREAQKETIRIQSLDNKRRIFAEKGPNAPRCFIQRGA